jgi:pimeloyl-ACP methyl ester carboxylesterase
MTAREQFVRGGAVRSASSRPSGPTSSGSTPSATSTWPPFRQAGAGFTVHAPFHPGVQGSEGVEAVDDVVDLALAYDELMGALGIDSAHLTGHFFGGMAAAELASICQGRAKKVVLISPLGLWLDAKPVADVVILPPAELRAVLWKDPESPAAREWATLPRTEEENVAAQIEQIQRLSAMGKFVWPIPDKGLKKRLHRVSAPTLIVWGEADGANPPAYAQEFARLIRGSTVGTMPGGHMLHLESPDAVADAAVKFPRLSRMLRHPQAAQRSRCEAAPEAHAGARYAHGRAPTKQMGLLTAR